MPASQSSETDVLDAAISVVHPSWFEFIESERSKPYFRQLNSFLDSELHSGYKIFPKLEQIFATFALTPLTELSVVLLGQDPYHGLGQAEGLAFSVPEGVKLPPSLRNMYQELQQDIGSHPGSGSLRGWATQGVLLLNTVLTVREGEALSHRNKGWEQFTDAAVVWIARHVPEAIFLLWGSNAQRKAELLKGSAVRMLEAAHPSPFSAYRGFFGCRHFSKVNAMLAEQGKTPIDWSS